MISTPRHHPTEPDVPMLLAVPLERRPRLTHMEHRDHVVAELMQPGSVHRGRHMVTDDVERARHVDHVAMFGEPRRVVVEVDGRADVRDGERAGVREDERPRRPVRDHLRERLVTPEMEREQDPDTQRGSCSSRKPRPAPSSTQRMSSSTSSDPPVRATACAQRVSHSAFVAGDTCTRTTGQKSRSPGVP